MNLETYKNIIDMAIANEIEAWEFYGAAAEKVKDPYLKEMFEHFAKEEKMHEKLLRNILKSDTISLHFREDIDYRVAETVDEPRLSMAMKPSDAIALAMKKEEQALNEYNMLAHNCLDKEQKKVFLDLAAMERGHKLKLEQAFMDVGYPEVW
ncbi:MAG: ferritin family protein [Desulfobacteraceae bacterium]|nr:ferritin family protein [Desulfobacteraceae bacterium]